jgi:uncharacterized protein HemY
MDQDELERQDAQGAVRGALGSAGGYFLGRVLNERGESNEAEAAFRRAAEHGRVDAALELGRLLKERGDLAGAQAVFQRTADHGCAQPAVELGKLLERSGELEPQ